jgi:autotransporter-associated beta strand protein
MGTFRTGLARAVMVGLLSGATVAPAAAATRTWVGGSGGLWSVAANWNENAAPVDGDDLVFSALGSGASNNDLTITVNSIALSVDHEIHCGGNDLGLTAGLSTSTPGTSLLLNCVVQLGGPQTWTVEEASVVTVHLNGFTWTIDNQALFAVSNILGHGAVAKSGPGTLQLNDNAFTGPLTINAGTAEARHAFALGTSADPANGTTVAAGASLIFYEDPAVGESLTLQGTGVGNMGALQVAGTNPVAFHGPIELAATTHIRSAGPAMTFWGVVNGPGELVILDNTTVGFGNNQNTLTAIGFAGTGSPVIRGLQPNMFARVRINLPAGATLDINDGFTEVAGLDGAGAVTLGPTGGQLVVKNTLPSTFTGTITGVGGSVYKDGPGTLTLGGANTFKIGPLITAGTVRVTHPNALGAGDGTHTTGTTVLAGATLALDGVAVANERIHLGGDTQPAILHVMGIFPSSLDGPVLMTQQAAITGTNGAPLTVNGELSIGTPITITNTFVHVMNAASSVGGLVTVNAGGTLSTGANGVFSYFTKVALNGGTFGLNGKTITLGELSGNGVFNFGNNGVLEILNTADATFAGTSSGTGTLTKSGSSAWTLSGPFAVSGVVTVSGGTLVVANDQALSTTPRVDVGIGAALRYAVAATVPYQISIKGSGTTGVDGAVQVLGGHVTFAGPFGANDFDGMVRVDAPHVLTWTGPLTLPTLHVGGSGTVVFGSAGNNIPHIGIGINPMNVPAGPTTVRPGVAGALGPFNLKVAAGATFDLNGFDQTVNYVQGEGTIAIGAKKLTIQNSSTFDGSFTGAGTIDASGQQLNVTGASTFTGSVTTRAFGNSGTLPASVHATDDTLTLLPNSVTGAVTMGAGVFLIAGDDTVAAAGVNTGNLELPADAFLSAWIHNGTTITVNGTVTLVGQLNPFLHPSVSTPGQVITLIDNDGVDPVIGMFGNFSEGSVVQIAEAVYRISYMGGTGNDVVLTKSDATYFLSEGATGAFFDTDLLIANPHPETADVSVSFYRDDGELEGYLYHVPAKSRLTIRVDDLEGMEATTFSTIVRSNNPALNLIVERTMRWDATGYGAHTEKATSGPALTWYFAEGSEGFFRTYLLLANPDFVANTATVTYLREAGEPAITRTYELDPDSRRTIQAADDPELVGRSFGMTVTFARRGIAERAMYFGENPVWKGGHESLGETVPSPTWFLAEGATGAGFDTFILVANPNVEETEVTYTFLSDSASPATITRRLAGLSRQTINIEAEELSIPDGPVATQVTATRPVIAERAQYWPDQWTEAHNSFGVTEAGLKWGLAEGRAGGPESYQTYILLANAGTEDARVQLQFLGEDGLPAPQPMTIDVPAQRRVNVPVTGAGDPEDPEAPAMTFGTIITSDKPIVVERAMYWNANGEVWAAGTNATATRLP